MPGLTWGSTCGAAVGGAGMATKSGADAHDHNPQLMAIIAAVCATLCRRVMSLLLLEALGAMVVLIFIVWWTMFSGRKNGEIKDDSDDSKEVKSERSDKP